MSGLAGRVALVTGASRGIGRAIALALAREGADVALCSTREGGCDEVARAVTGLGRRALTLAGDVAAPPTVTAWVARTREVLGPVDILVNNAGIALRVPLSEAADGVLERTLAVNLGGPYHLCRQLVPAMVARRWGRVVNVSSISATLGTAGFTAYCASKWGLSGFTKALAEEVRGTGVLVTAVLPGSTDTDMLRQAGFPPAMKPDDVAGVVRYLCHGAPEAMQGTLVEVFG